MKSNFKRTVSEIRVFTALVMKLIDRDQEERLSLRFPGRTGIQLGVLRILRNRPYTLSEISGFMHLSPPTLVPVIDRLEKDGLITRVPDPHDRRRKQLVLNAQGLALLKKTHDLDQENALVNGLADMEPQECQKLNQLLQQLVRNMSQDANLVEIVLENLTHLEKEEE